MPASQAKQNYRAWLAFVAALLATSASFSVANMIAPLDLLLHEKLGTVFGKSVVSTDSLFSLPGVLAVTLLAFAAVVVGLRLLGKAQRITWLQLFVASIVIQWFFLTVGQPESPCAFLLAIVLGGLFGYLLRLIWLRERKLETQYYELVLRNRELQEARLQMVKQDEIDRRLLSADLHDQVLNDLKAVGQKVSSLKQNPREDTSKEIDRLLQHAMNNVREVMDSLSPSILEHLGFAAAVEDCLRQAAERGGFKIRFRNAVAESVLNGLGSVEQVLLYRLVQECCNNICKHAHAERVKGSVEFHDEQIVIRIEDDGKGIDPTVRSTETRGLKYMRQRADLVGATIAWLPGMEGKGTSVEIKLPLKGRDDARINS
jgi:signal transduction histidine kinase